MSGTRKRRGTTLVELSLVIAILAMIALPFAAFVSQNLKNTVQSSTQLKEQMVLEQVMQDMEEHLRSAISINGTTACLITFLAGRISFTSRGFPPRAPEVPPPTAGTLPLVSTYTYELKPGLFYKNGTVFPDGLEANMITSLTFPEWSSDLIPLKIQNLDATKPPCYLTVRIEADDTYLQKTIYLRNYTSIIDIAKILGVTAPATGAIPVTSITITSTAEYTGAVAWTGALTSEGKFKNQTVYTAKITLAPIGDYTLTGVAANFFTVAGTTVDATNAANSGVVTAVFPAIGATQLSIAAPTLTTSKPYDGNTTAVVTAGTLIGVVSPDIVTVTTVATYDTATVGTGKTITVVYTLGGADAGNYVKPENYTATGTITAKAITVTATGPSKAYGTALTAGTSTTNFMATGAITGETVTSVTLTPDAAGLSATTAAGVTYVVTPSLATGTGGFLASNYTITYVPYSGTVSAKPLTITGTALTLSKPYDGNTTATVTAVGTLSGVVSGDAVTVTAVATYNSAAVGVGKTITVVYILAGGQAANYVKPVNDTVATGAITTKQLTITAPALTLSKPYDGNTTAAVTAGALSGVVSPDVVTVTAVATYDTAAVGTSKTITVVYILGGAQAGNYVKPVNYTVATGVITPLVQINIAAIPGVTVPVAGATPVTAITATTQYTGTVTWLPLGTTFAGKTVYTATITLTPKAGYTLMGVAANFFTVDGTHGRGATNNADSGVVEAIFPQTGNWP